MKCLVKNCTNEEHQGNGIILQSLSKDWDYTFWICMPCWLYATKGEANSQLERNAQVHFVHFPVPDMTHGPIMPSPIECVKPMRYRMEQ